MLFPKKVKFRKWHTGRKSPEQMLRPDTRGITIAFGAYGLKATSPGRLSSNQIEAARKVISRSTGKIGKSWIRVFPDKPQTQKAAEVGMGKGKGDPQRFIFEVRPGRIIFELDGVSEEMARESFRKAGSKLPFKSTFVKREA